MSSTPRTTLTTTYPEQATAVLTATLTDADGKTALLNADSVLTSLTLTLYVERGGAVINSRSAQSILNVNGGTVNSAALLTLRLDPADMTVSGGFAEVHIALLAWTWGSPLKTGRHEIAFTVGNLAKVGTA
jgi:hypothetical protein